MRGRMWQRRGKAQADEVLQYAHIFFDKPFAEIKSEATPLQLEIHQGVKWPTKERTGMTVIGTCSYLVPGDEQKTTLMKKLVCDMYTPLKQWRYLKIYAGFDHQFANAKRVSKREINLQAGYRATSMKDDSVPFIK